MMASNNVFCDKRVVILGLARQGTALAGYLATHGADVIVSDLRSERELGRSLDELESLPIVYVLGRHPISLLDDADVLFLSGGVPLDAPLAQEAMARGIPLSNDSELFLTECPATVIGVTGSAGKTTTTALVGEMCKASGRKTWVGGNIGRSLLPDLDSIQPDDLVVMELSSFQLEIMTTGTQVAAILNLTPNHLDRHKTMQVYTAAKARLLENQSANSTTVLGRDDPGAWKLHSKVSGRLRAFSMNCEVDDGAFVRGNEIILIGVDGEIPVCSTCELKLLGRHNILNVLASAVLADSVSVPVNAIAQVSRSFTGVEHRLELVRELNGVRWYDDSIATAPERLMAALSSFDRPVILLAGGRDKDLPWQEAADMMQEQVEHLVLFGEAAEMIHSHLDPASRLINHTVQVKDLEQAVGTAARLARPGDIVLLSPGGTSFDAYKDFVERGEHFKHLVESLRV
ncbi:MAG: UDP-N-acetylmuramoyl-L-alanine--D-glutamate ligase [Anaerolineales bacterium]|nr:UDP-N-acetylmuramoyl-L-alanine--D-glutamate ligase [Anaerolineales bacterium]